MSASEQPPTPPPVQPPPPPPPPPPGGAVAYPVSLEIERQPEYDKLRALVRCPYAFILNIITVLIWLPHLICLAALGIAAFVVYLVSCFAVLFTGQYPRGLFDFMVGVQRWSHRFSSWVFLLTDAYPPFSFEPDAHPLQFEVRYPEEGVARWRGIPLLCAILAIPVTIVADVILFIGYLLLVIPPFIPGVIQLIILFTGQYPEGLFNLVRGGVRLAARAQAYSLFQVTTYPPFDLS